jgi:hypothetical protein
MIFVATKNGRTKKFSSALSVLLLDPESGMDKNQDPGLTSQIRTTERKVAHPKRNFESLNRCWAGKDFSPYPTGLCTLVISIYHES